MSEFINRVGERYLNNQGHWLTIVVCRRSKDCDIQFDNGCIIKNVTYDHIKNGHIKNPYHKSLLGVGFIGEGKYKAPFKGKEAEMHKSWQGALDRCYRNKKEDKYPAYAKSIVAEEWHCFQNFAEWADKNYNSDTMKEWELDKDILIKGNKSYSSETCCFVPREINILFVKADSIRGKYPIGVRKHGKRFQAKISKNSVSICLGSFDTPEEAFEAYKIAKEDYIKEKADEWKPLIKPNVYEAMYAYQVEITD